MGFDLLLNVHQTRRFVEYATVSLYERDTKKSPPSGELCNRLIPAEEIRPTRKCPDGCLVIGRDASSIGYCRN